MADHDEDWLDALAGAQAPADARQQSEIDALRRAARALDSPPVDELAERRLLERLEREGLIEARHVRERLGMRHVARAAVVILCLGLALEWFLFQPPLPPAAVEPEAGAPAPAKTEQEAAAQAERERRAEPQRQQFHAPPRPADDAAPALAEPRALREEQAETLQDRHAPAAPKAAAPPLLIVSVADPAAARQQLTELLQKDGIEQLDELDTGANRAETYRLRCATAAACQELNAWLQDHGAPAAFAPGQARELRLRER